MAGSVPCGVAREARTRWIGQTIVRSGELNWPWGVLFLLMNGGMMALRYKPGAWIGARRGTIMVFLAPESDSFIIDEIWALLRGDARAGELADAIMDRPDPLLSVMPDFVIVSAGSAASTGDGGAPSGAQILVRGSSEVHVETGRGVLSVGNWQGDRWQETNVEDALRMRVEFPRPNPIADSISGPPPWLFGGGDSWFPLVDGIAPMGEIMIELPSIALGLAPDISTSLAAPVDLSVPHSLAAPADLSVPHSLAAPVDLSAENRPAGERHGTDRPGALMPPADRAPGLATAERDVTVAEGSESCVAIVPTLLCDRGHSNPPDRSRCCDCGSALDSTVVPMPRPSMGVIRFTTGTVVDLTNSIVIGRSPTPVRSGRPPILVSVPIGGHDVSRNHIEIELDDWSVLATDLASANGTTLFRVGGEPRAIIPMMPVVLVDGDILDMGDGIAIRYETAISLARNT